MRTLDSLAPCKILLVDDQDCVHDAYRRVLSSSRQTQHLDRLEAELFGELAATSHATPERRKRIEYELHHAFDGARAIQMGLEAMSANDPFEMAFVDLQMPPGIDGIETIERLWKIDPLLQVVICPAVSDYCWATVIERIGFVDNLLLLKKPFANEEVFQLAMAMTHKRRALLNSELQMQQLRCSNEQLQKEIWYRMAAESELKHAASHDHLTRLPNRNYLKLVLATRFGKELACQQNADALIFLDLDNFKVINDSLGHAVGDELLIQVAERLRSEVSKVQKASRPAVDAGTLECLNSGESPPIAHNLVARLGGDEFVILLVDVESQDLVMRFAEQLRQEICLPYRVNEHVLNVGTSLGVAFRCEAASTAEELMRNADLAMYRAKFSGKRCVAVFDREMHASMARRLEIEESLRTVIQDGHLRLVFQPIFDIRQGTITGLESLARWDHPTKGLISPTEFIPVAEETGLILPIGQWVLEQVCKAIKDLNRFRQSNPISVSVNVSKRQIAEPAFVMQLEEAIRANQISSDQLNLEITESLIMESPEEIAERLIDIRSLGVRLHMDDFGTGHSSLSCLHRFPIDVLKIDRSFVSTMRPGDDYESIIHAIITLAHSLGTEVIAEGIETTGQLQQLRDLECDFGQGFLYSRPRPIERLYALVSNGIPGRKRITGLGFTPPNSQSLRPPR